MTRQELIQNVQSYMTGSYGIAPRINETEISNRIDDALRWFYREYNGAAESKYYIVKNDYFDSKEFIQTRAIQMPDCVMFVAECKEANNATKLNFGESEISIGRLIASDIFLGSYTSDDLMNRVAFASYWDLTKAFLHDWKRYKFNENTKRLIIQGAAPQTDLAIRAWVKIDETMLFDDPYFIDYVRGLSLESMGRMMSVITMNLAGGASINTEMLRAHGKELIDSVKAYIKEEQPSNYVEFYH